jgi:hypothetical protein
VAKLLRPRKRRVPPPDHADRLRFFRFQPANKAGHAAPESTTSPKDD